MSSALAPRQERVLKAVVEGFVASSQPVGSAQVLRAGPLGCSSATVRKEMQVLMEGGYIEQPHTSAGRIPTDKGYRFYVDTLMSLPRESGRLRRRIERRLERYEGWVEAICGETCQLLLDATGQAAIVISSALSDVVTRQVHLTRVAPRALVVMVALSTGQVVHRTLAAERAPSRGDITRWERGLRRALVGKCFGEGVKAFTESVKGKPIVSAERSLARALEGMGEASEIVEQVYLSGASHIAEAPEFRESERLPDLLGLLDEGERLGRTVLSVSGGRDFAVSIGGENPAEEMRGCSLVLRSVGMEAERRARATLAVLGPTRMDYAHVAGALRDLAREVSRWLSRG